MLKDIISGIIAVIIIVFMIVWERKNSRMQHKNNYHEKSEHEKDVEREIAIERERNRRPPGGWGGGF